MTAYRGYICGPDGPRIVGKGADGILLPTRSLKVWNHSPTGFSWGYAGSGPAQLALALLLDVTNDERLSVRLHQRFKQEVVVRWPMSGEWKITSDEILGWVRKQQSGGEEDYVPAY